MPALGGKVLCSLTVGAVLAVLGVTGASAARSSTLVGDPRATESAGTATGCPAGERVPATAVTVSRHTYGADVSAVTGWDVVALVVQGRDGYQVYRPGAAGLSLHPPWSGLRAPADAEGRPQPVSGGFACGTPSARRPAAAPDAAACLRILADRRNFSYVVGGTTYEYAGLVTVPTQMTQVDVVAKPGLVIPDGCRLPFSLASYATQGPTWPLSGTQRLVDKDTDDLTATRRSITLRVTPADCFGQIDLYPGMRTYDGAPGHGPAPDYATGTNVPRFLIATWNGGTACVAVVPTPTPSSPATTPVPAATSPAVTTSTSPAVVEGTKHSSGPTSGGRPSTGGGDTDVRGTKVGNDELAASGSGVSPVRGVPLAVLLLTVGSALCRAGRRMRADPVHELIYGGRQVPSHRW